MKKYKVKKGDTWYQIALDNKMELNTLLKANKKNKNDLLYAGQTIIIPELNEFKKIIYNPDRGNSINRVILTKPARYDNKEIEECARMANLLAKEENYISSGDAWTRHDNQKTIYSGYDTRHRPTKYNRGPVENYEFNAADDVKKNFDISNLDKERLYTVGMYFKGSGSLEKAYDNGVDDVAHTHTGNLVFDKKKNKWVVIHNIHGKLITNDINDVLGSEGKYGITSIYSPRKNTFTGKIDSFIRWIFKNGGKIDDFTYIDYMKKSIK